MKQSFSLWLIIIAYLVTGGLYATLTPAWEAPDEPAHYNYVRQLANGRLPVIEPGDYDQAYIVQVVFESHFAPEYDISRLTYEDWQPPLYYLLQWPVYRLTRGSLPAMRLVSVVLGAGVIVLAYGIARQLFPDEKWIALTTAVFVAFLPQHVAIMASVNNDSLAELLIAAILYVLIDWSRQVETSPEAPDNKRLVWLGGLLGLGFLTKGTVYVMAPVTAVVLWWALRHQRQQLLQAAMWVFVPALLLGSVWWGRNLVVYGGWDILGKQAHDAVVTGQPRTAEWVAQYGLWGTITRFWQTTFHSFWGQFGWMTVPMPSWVYVPLGLFTAVSGLGWLGAVWHSWHQPGKQAKRPFLSALILGSTFLLTLSLHAGYNLTFVQHQGRYLFPALIPIGLGITIGLGMWIRPLRQRWSWAIWLLPLGLGIALFSLDLLALYRFILPALT
ncbi:MAG: DUF2142 domain-containing protein [Chloroflexi bacterium]|nr:MAG: DUF2142 domain-containing protein [Chloroflexota bacterium]